MAWDEAIEQVVKWGSARTSRYICICNVHSVVTATRDQVFQRALGGADMATCDGAPIAWALRRLGFPGQERIAGPDLMWRYLHKAKALGHRVYLYGSTETTLSRLVERIARDFPGIVVVGMHSPPFHSPASDDEAAVAEINRSGPNVVFVGLGCPKQEKWMAAHSGNVNALMIGVGAAFDYHSGTLKRAPLWLQRHGLEWLYRLACEPRRLMRRYLVTNSLFVVRIAAQLICSRWTHHKMRHDPEVQEQSRL
ncbi:WecB/TagA/CpsF family glycosyltransferase [Massilia sp. LXY-6]|uniref:WecB/TagA/CpsF family glycosyltransferase n=1 Tax=Massilia sp. LXY-6 TaxID=3379823 RepID=UPI003EE2AB01